MTRFLTSVAIVSTLALGALVLAHAAPAKHGRGRQAGAATVATQPVQSGSGIVIVRSGQEYGGWNELLPGTNTIVVSSDDPNLASDYASVKAHGYTAGIMVAANGMAPAAFGRLLASIENEYQPAVLVPDLEFMGNGQHVDRAWNSAAVAAYTGDTAGLKPMIAVTFTGQQATDFAYSVWNTLGAQYWPQTFNGDMTLYGDPAKIMQQVQAAAGSSAVTVLPVLSPSVMGTYAGPSVAYMLGPYVGYAAPPSRRGRCRQGGGKQGRQGNGKARRGTGC